MTQDQDLLGRTGSSPVKAAGRSWGLGTRASVLASVAAGIGCLGGATCVPVDARAVYERFGAPVAVLPSGFHVVLPWPFGRVRRLDFGAVRSVALAGQPGTRVLYRVGMTDAQAMDAAYASADPGGLVQAAGDEALLGSDAWDDRGVLGAIQTRLDKAGSGLEALGVLRAPPAEDAGVVQAAEIAAGSTVAEARNMAAIERAQARQQAASQVAAARAQAAETVASAQSALIGFTGDQAANKADGKTFLLERYLTNLSHAIATAPKTIIDHRLNWPAAPELDLRPPPGIANALTDGR